MPTSCVDLDPGHLDCQQALPHHRPTSPSLPPGCPTRPFRPADMSPGRSMDMVRAAQEEYARAGYFTAAIDCRYHGERCVPDVAAGQTARDVYQDALVRWGCTWAHDTCQL